MTKHDKPKIDIIGWILGLFIPKKSKPSAPTNKNLGMTSKPVQPFTEDIDTSNPTPPQQQASVAPPPVTVKSTPQLIHSVSAPPPRPAPINPAAAPSSGQSQLTRLSPKPARKPLFKFESGKVMPTVWTVASVLSLIVNLILIVVLVVLARELFVLKALVGDQLLGGLYQNFIYMDLAHIKTEITVKDNIPINFTLPISQDTVVTLTENTPINGANVRITSGGLTINSAANIVLPRGTSLPVHLQLDVPVNTTVPITIKVPVDIPLQETELHKPFIGLQQVVDPFYKMLMPQYKKASDIPICKPFSSLCNTLFATP